MPCRVSRWPFRHLSQLLRDTTRVFAVLVDVGSSAEGSVRQWADQVHRAVDLVRDTQTAQDAAVAVFGTV